jgi:hypothetical protein
MRIHRRDAGPASGSAEGSAEKTKTGQWKAWIQVWVGTATKKPARKFLQDDKTLVDSNAEIAERSAEILATAGRGGMGWET